MRAIQLYEKLEKDFIKKGMNDDWIKYMDPISDFLTDNYKERSMGLVTDFTPEIHKVYTAVFPSRKVMEKILKDKVKNAMLFVHHPANWDIRTAPNIFHQMERDLLEEFKEKKISIYNLHSPLDNYGEYSTSGTLAREINIKIEKPFGVYQGTLCGVIGKTNFVNIHELKEKFQKIIGHEASLYNYGENEIKNHNVAVIGGGGNNIDFLEEIRKEEVNTFITGITVKNEYSKETHDFAEKHKINILGGTHYSTEKFACIAMVNYFKKLNISSEFIEDEPLMEDL